ncbi:MAG: hypothetical protein QOF61_1369 [Acidobacteriota bacterium]|jgi:hypothetical protein|nr:hypothetical protein [Acidobacteriota bacterium]
MFGKEAHKISDERLDRMGRLVVRSAASSAEEEADAVAASPFLYTRIAARIEERRRKRQDEGWLTLLAVAWRAVPVMAIVAAIASALLLWVGVSGATSATNQLGFEALSDTRGTGVVSTVLSDNSQLSHDDVLQIVVNRDETESHK